MPITAFTTLAGTDIDALSPAKASVFDALNNRAMHCQEALYDPTIHTPQVAHDHDGLNSASAWATCVPNLMIGGRPHLDNVWTVAGSAAHSANGMVLSAASASAYRVLMNGNASISRTVFGTGAPVAVSMCVKSTGTFTNLGFEFGLGDGTTFRTGAKGSLTHADITTSWKRFWFPLASFAPTTGTNAAFLMKTTAAFTGGTSLTVDFCMVRLGQRLTWWQPGYAEGAHGSWKNLQQGSCPVFDYAIMFTNATRVTPS